MNIPMTARVGFAVVLTAVITPAVATSTIKGIAMSGGGFGLLMLFINQVLIGLVLGLMGALVVYGIESAGRIIDTQRGSNMSDIVAPMTGERTSPTGQWLMMLAVSIMVATDQHLLLLRGVVNSFTLFPPTSSLSWVGSPHDGHASEFVLRLADFSGQSLIITLSVAAPAMFSLLMADVMLGIINRGAPQVNVFALSQVIKGPLGIAAVLLSLMAVANYIDQTVFDCAWGAGDSWLNTMLKTMHTGREYDYCSG